MASDPRFDFAPPPRLLGQVLRRSDRHEAALVLHEGTLWVADFVDGEGVLVEPAKWVRFHCGGAELDATHRRITAESGLPLTPALVRAIARLLQAGPHREEP